MENYEILINIFIYSLIPTLLSLYLTEKIKGNVKNTFDKKIEVLKNQHSIELSKLQTELDFLKTKESYKFAKLHEKRFVVLEKSYKYLNEAIKNLDFYISPLKSLPNDKTFEQNEDELNEKFRTSHNKFSNYFANNRIYFDQDLEYLIDKYFNETISIYNDYFENYALKKLGGGFDPEKHRIAYQAYKKIPEKIYPIKREIEVKFRDLLGE